MQRALGWDAGPESRIEAMPKCGRCGRDVRFSSDELGRTLEVCDPCKLAKLVSTGSAIADRAAADKAVADARLAKRAKLIAATAKRHEARTCKNVRCGQSFSPVNSVQVFCSPRCAGTSAAIGSRTFNPGKGP